MKTSWRRLEDIIRLCLQKTSSRRLQNVLIKTNIIALVIRLQDVFAKASPRHLQNVFKTTCKNVFKTSSRRLQDVLKTSSRCLQDLLQRYLKDVFKTYRQIKLFFLISLRDVFKTFLRRTAKRVIYRRIFLGHTSQKFIVSVQNLEEW